MIAVVSLDPRTSIEPIIREERGEYVVGRVGTGEFVVMPELGRRALELFGQRHDLASAGRLLEREHGSPVDLEAFVRQLLDLGFVRSIGGLAIDDDDGFRDSLAWLRPAHVRPLFGRTAAGVLVALAAAAVAALAARPDLRPTPRMFFWTSWTSAALLANATLDYATMALHELAHLAAARSVGVPARLGLGVRLLGIVAHTDLRGIWAVPRRQRLRMYVAGLAADVAVTSLAVLVAAAAGPPVRHVLVALVLMRVIGMLWQCQIYTRTDLYCLVADLAGARNLHEDATIYAIARFRRAGGRVRSWMGADERKLADPLAGVAGRELAAIRRYAVLMLTGSAVALAGYCAVVVPIDVGVFGRGVHALRDGLVIDGISTLALAGIPQALLAYLIAARGLRRIRRLRARLTGNTANEG